MLFRPIASVPPELTGEHRRKWMQYAIFSLIVIGAKFWLINRFGNQTPFWDQWDGEAAAVYIPFRQGTFQLADIFKPHNEHHIFTTKSLSLLLLIINKTWNPLLQMLVNALIHCYTLFAFCRYTEKATGHYARPALLSFAVVIFCLPFAWENTLAGFQSCFYFVLLFSVLGLWYTNVYEPLTLKWWYGLVFSSLAFLSLASGMFVFATSAALAILTIVSRRRTGQRQWIALGLNLALFAAAYLLTKTVTNSADKPVFSLRTAEAFFGTLGWPFRAAWWPALLCNLPMLAFLVQFLKRPPVVSDRRWFILAMSLWSLGQSAILAYGRADAYLSTRYFDLFAIGILVNMACLLSLLQTVRRMPVNRKAALIGAWVLLIFAGLANEMKYHVIPELMDKDRMNMAQEANVRAFMSTGDSSALTGKSRMEIPYPDPARLMLLLKDTSLGPILPAAIQGSLPVISREIVPSPSFIPKGYYASVPSRGDSIFGSYGASGDSVRGQIRMTYRARSGGALFLPIAGYPLAKDIRIRLVQDGQDLPLTIRKDPQEQWDFAEARVRAGEFTIVAQDESLKTWVALGPPTMRVRGTLDKLTTNLLGGFAVFLVLGLSLWVFMSIKPAQ